MPCNLSAGQNTGVKKNKTCNKFVVSGVRSLNLVHKIDQLNENKIPIKVTISSDGIKYKQYILKSYDKSKQIRKKIKI